MRNKVAIGIVGLFLSLTDLTMGWVAVTIVMVLYIISIIVVKKFLALSVGARILTVMLIGLALCLVAGWH